MAHMMKILNQRTIGIWLTTGILIAFALCQQVFAASRSYTYDSLNRLTKIDYGDGAREDFSYDAAGNRLSYVVTGILDADGDGISDSIDNCPTVSNPNQLNTDGDSEGNVCDADDDEDGVADILDNAPLNKNICRDADNDTCDDCTNGTDNPANDGIDSDIDELCNAGDTDDDNDGLNDSAEYLRGTNPLLTDTDGDGYSDYAEVQGGSDPLDIDSLPIVDITLPSGWNLISLPLQPSDISIEMCLDTVSNMYNIVWAYEDSEWKMNNPSTPIFNTLETMEAGKGYWIYMTAPATLTISGISPSNSVPLTIGWNLVGYNSKTAQPIADVLASINGKYISVWAFINNEWQFYAPGNIFNTLETMEPGYGYWINTTEECTWTLDVTPTMDGVITAGEWDNADIVNIEIAQGWTVPVYYKHDASNIYIVFTNLLKDGDIRYPEVVLDMNNDKSFLWGQDDWWFHASFSDCEGNGAYSVYTFGDTGSCQEDHNGWAANNFIWMQPIPEAIEIQISYDKIGLVPGAGKTIGITFDVTDTNTAYDFWPQTSNLANPSTWGTWTLP